MSVVVPLEPAQPVAETASAAGSLPSASPSTMVAPVSASAPASSPIARPSPRALAVLVGGAVLVATVLFASTPAVGIAATIAGAAALAWGAPALGAWRRWRALPHALAAALAALAVVGLCATRCGGYAAYERFLGMPTALAGLLMHGAVALAAAVTAHDARRASWVDAAIAVAIGASVFYAAALVALAGWCGACGAIHASMAVQAAFLLRAAPRALPIALMLAAAGGVNAVYHHRPAEVRDDPAALLAYLRGLWTSPQPPQPVLQYADGEPDVDPPPPPHPTRASYGVAHPAGAHAAVAAGARPADIRPSRGRAARDRERAGRDDQRIVRDVDPASSPAAAPIAASDDPTAQRAVAPPAVAERAAADATRWGRADAPVTMIVAIDTGCPACAGHFAQLLELRDLIEAGRVQARFLLLYRNEAAQATASLAYAAGFLGDAPMIDALTAFYRAQKRILVPADALATLPPSLPRATAVAALKRHQQDVSALLGDAAKLKERLGATSEPTTWLMPSGQTEPARTFQGATVASILRLAALSLMPADARELPTFPDHGAR